MKKIRPFECVGLKRETSSAALRPLPTFEIVEQRFSWRERRHLLSEVPAEGVVGQLEGLLRAVRPQVPIHAAVHRLAVLVTALGYQCMRSRQLAD